MAAEPWSAAKAKANFWKWFTIDLIVVSLATYAFELSLFWVWLFVVAPLVLRKRVIAFMMNPQAGGIAQIAVYPRCSRRLIVRCSAVSASPRRW